MCADPVARRGIPDATVARLPGYLRALASLAADGVLSVSSEELAQTCGVRSTQLRKDLSLLGSAGVRGVGYDVDQLVGEISALLGLDQERPIAIVGLGNLGRALAAYDGFRTSGFSVRALVDADPALTGVTLAGIEVSSMDDLDTIVPGRGIVVGVITTPAEAAQSVCDRLVAAGVRSILTFAPRALAAAPGVTVRRVDLATELHVLAFRERSRELLAQGVS